MTRVKNLLTLAAARDAKVEAMRAKLLKIIQDTDKEDLTDLAYWDKIDKTMGWQAGAALDEVTRNPLYYGWVEA